MSRRDSNFKSTPWLGSLYQKFGKMYDDVGRSMNQDTVKDAKNQLHSVGEKLASHVLFDLAFPDFLTTKANQTSQLVGNSLNKPKINSEVIDIECPANAKSMQLAAKEFMCSSSEEVSNTAADLPSKPKDDHWSSENRRTNVEVDLKVEKASSSVALDSTCSDDGSSELSSQSSLTIMGQEVEAKDQIPPSSEPWADLFRVDSLFQSASVKKNEEDADDLFMKMPFSLTTNEPQSGLFQPAEPFCDSVSEFVSDLSTSFDCSELEDSVVSFLSESTDEVGFPSSSSFSSHPYKICLSNSSSSSIGTFPLNLARQSNGSINMPEDLPMEKIDLSDRAELDHSGVVVENNMDLSISTRTRSSNPYKKKFRNPFIVKKRLEKDYKLLGIWFGDIDDEFSSLTRSNETFSPAVRNKGAVDDSEWEIV